MLLTATSGLGLTVNHQPVNTISVLNHQPIMNHQLANLQSAVQNVVPNVANVGMPPQQTPPPGNLQGNQGGAQGQPTQPTAAQVVANGNALTFCLKIKKIVMVSKK